MTAARPDGTRPVLGVIGGSGLYALEGLRRVREVDVDTPYGRPSGRLVRGELELAGAEDGVTLLFMPRHGSEHAIPPSAINYRANVCAMKLAGATHLVSVSAVGSMKEAIAPGHLVVPDQYIDLTRRRVGTFFDEGAVAHVPFADPVCADLAEALSRAADEVHEEDGRPLGQVHRGGTYVCIEGPQFSTRAESRLYRSWGASVIGMTALPEAKLAREAELPYATLALATDYDCWHETEEDVSAPAILAVMRSNVERAKRVVALVAKSLPPAEKSRAHGALRGALLTAEGALSPETRERLGWLLKARLSE